MTARLRLQPIRLDDADAVAAVCAIFTDPATWKHMPTARPGDDQAVEAYLAGQADSWQKAGLGRWVIRLQDSGDCTVIGVGGCDMADPATGTWDLGYRLGTTWWGHGYATEVARAGLDAAHHLRPDLPVTANVVENNPASWHILDKLGLHLVWTGHGTVSELTYRVYADRPLDDATLQRVIAK